ncbi:hypothetical protein [Micromonospora sagamiensis]|uniref:hypothetical protein n=1 Tax=Micromonospora sagamiensis TaxID=47875 RepID=UPI0011A1BFB1|nr:hypothetical protein [Micromonospora sagamiensis]BCL15611.1 hypothetical protein GCM10017556_33500 [Micromonospora sagamiensis]
MGISDRPPTGSRGGGHPLRVDFAEWTQTAVFWVGASATAGVIGNAAYDAIKAAVARLKSVHPAGPRDRDPDAVLLARSTVNLRCVQLGTGELAAETVQEVLCRWTPDGWTVQFLGESLNAIVDLSAGPGGEGFRAEVRMIEHPDTHRYREMDAELGRFFVDNGWG